MVLEIILERTVRSDLSSEVTCELRDETEPGRKPEMAPSRRIFPCMLGSGCDKCLGVTEFNHEGRIKGADAAEQCRGTLYL